PLEHVTVRAEPVAVRARLVLRGPALEVLQLASGPLREEVVGDAERQLPARSERGGTRVVVGKAVPAAPAIDHAGHAESMRLPLEVPRAGDLASAPQLRQRPDR